MGFVSRKSINIRANLFQSYTEITEIFWDKPEQFVAINPKENPIRTWFGDFFLSADQHYCSPEGELLTALNVTFGISEQFIALLENKDSG